MRLVHISAVCHSYENAVRFYTEILGMHEAKKFSIDQDLTNNIFGVSCTCLIVLFENESCTIEVFIPEHAVAGKNPFVHHCIAVDDLDAFVRSCSDQNLPVNRVPKGDKQLIFVEDFDGNLFEVKG